MIREKSGIIISLVTMTRGCIDPHASYLRVSFKAKGGRLVARRHGLTVIDVVVSTDDR